jgi:hypothetical protein
MPWRRLTSEVESERCWIAWRPSFGGFFVGALGKGGAERRESER